MFRRALALCGLTILTTRAFGQGSIVINGSFNTQSLYSDGIPGWSYDGFSFISGGLPTERAFDGHSYVGVNTYFSQNLFTPPGQDYTLTFSRRGDIPSISTQGRYGLRVDWGAQD